MAQGVVELPEAPLAVHLTRDLQLLTEELERRREGDFTRRERVAQVDRRVAERQLAQRLVRIERDDAVAVQVFEADGLIPQSEQRVARTILLRIAIA